MHRSRNHRRLEVNQRNRNQLDVYSDIGAIYGHFKKCLIERPRAGPIRVLNLGVGKHVREVVLEELLPYVCNGAIELTIGDTNANALGHGFMQGIKSVHLKSINDTHKLACDADIVLDFTPADARRQNIKAVLEAGTLMAASKPCAGTVFDSRGLIELCRIKYPGSALLFFNHVDERRDGPTPSRVF